MSTRYDVNRIFYNDVYRLVRYNDEEDVKPSTFFYLVSETDVQGVRKAKYFTLSLKMGVLREYTLTSGDPPQPVALETFADNAGLYWALLYSPEGIDSVQLFVGNNNGVSSLYNPSSNVMASGFIKPNSEVQRIQIPLSRNLNAGDSILIALRDNVITDWTEGSRYREANVAIGCEFAVSF